MRCGRARLARRLPDHAPLSVPRKMPAADRRVPAPSLRRLVTTSAPPGGGGLAQPLRLLPVSRVALKRAPAVWVERCLGGVAGPLRRMPRSANCTWRPSAQQPHASSVPTTWHGFLILIAWRAHALVGEPICCANSTEVQFALRE